MHTVSSVHIQYHHLLSEHKSAEGDGLREPYAVASILILEGIVLVFIINNARLSLLISLCNTYRISGITLEYVLEKQTFSK